MKRKSRGQALVEFALVFPLIMFLIFASIDFGYYVFGWSETQFAARRGAEQASKNQPREVRTPEGYHDGYEAGDPCFRLIVLEAAKTGSFNPATKINSTELFISYHQNGADQTARYGSSTTDKSVQAMGRVVQVRINKIIKPLTPVSDWLLGGRDFTFNSISRRTIVANGPPFIDVDPNGNDYQKCTNPISTP